MQIETVPLDELHTYPHNPRRGDVNLIAESLQVSGQYKPIVVQKSTDFILAGNHTFLAAKQLGWSVIDIVRLDVSDAAARTIVLTDNRTSDIATYDDAALLELLGDMDDLSGTGYSQADLDELIQGLEEGEREENTGTLLSVADVTVGDPSHETHNGQVWNVGQHVLVVARVADQHDLWAQYLAGRRFAPYPDPYFTCTDTARENDLLLVQPNTYLAGHLLDKHEAFFPGTVVAA